MKNAEQEADHFLNAITKRAKDSPKIPLNVESLNVERKKDSSNQSLKKSLNIEQEADHLLSTIAQNNEISEFSFPRYLAEEGAKGLISNADLGVLLNPAFSPGNVPDEYLEEMQANHRALGMPSERIQQGLEKIGIPLNTQVPTNAAQRMAGEAVKMGTGMLGLGGLGKAANYVGMNTLGRFLGSPSSAREASKLFGLGTGIGATSGGLQEMGMPKLWSDIAASLIFPGSVYGAGKIWEGGKGLKRSFSEWSKPPILSRHSDVYENFSPGQIKEAEKRARGELQSELGSKEYKRAGKKLDEYIPGEYGLATSDVTGSTRLAQIEKATFGTKEGIKSHAKHEENLKKMRGKIEGFSSDKYGPEATQEHFKSVEKGLQKEHEAQRSAAHEETQKHLSKFEPTVEPEVAGQNIREHASTKVESLHKKAQKEAKPHYEAAFKKEEFLDTPLTNKYIEEVRKTADTETLRMLNEVEKNISPLGKKSQIEKNRKKLVVIRKNASKRSPKVLQSHINKMEAKTFASAEKLENARKAIQRKIEDLAPHEKNKKRILVDIVKRLDLDIDSSTSAPHLKKARDKYKDILQPANEITENPTFQKILKQNKGYNKEYTVADSQIPPTFMRAPKEDVIRLNELIKNSKSVQENVRAYINKDFVDNVVEDGVVNLKKLESWRDKNKNAFRLYPNLATRISNVHNAQQYVNRLAKQHELMMKDFYKNAAEKVLNADPDKIMKNVMQGKNAESLMARIVKIAKEDKTGAALDGLRFAEKNRFLGPKKELTATRVIDYVNNHKKALEKLYEPEQVKALEEMSKYMLIKEETLRRAKVPGSPTQQNLTNRSIIDGIVSLGPLEYLKSVRYVGWLFKAGKAFQKDNEAAYKAIMEEIFSDPEYAKALWKTPKEIMKDSGLSKKLKERAFRGILSARQEEDEE